MNQKLLKKIRQGSYTIAFPHRIEGDESAKREARLIAPKEYESQLVKNIEDAGAFFKVQTVVETR